MAGREESEPGATTSSRLLRRLKVLTILAVVAALGWGVDLLWRRVSPNVIRRQQYLLPAQSITINEPPAWIRADIRAEVIRNADLDRRLSILDDGFVQAIEDAFALHPWVESVTRIVKQFPPAVNIELVYRRPIAVVEIAAGGTVQLLPVDAQGVHLPAADVPEIRRRYLPRISGIVGQPPVGGRWDDPRVDGAVDLADRLHKVWEAMHLVEILPSARPEILGPRRYFVYDLVTRGGTRVIWGAAPLDSPPGEADFQEKLERLTRCVRELGPLDSVRSPAIVNVRRGLSVTPRTAGLLIPNPLKIKALANRLRASWRATVERIRVAAADCQTAQASTVDHEPGATSVSEPEQIVVPSPRPVASKSDSSLR